MENINPFTNDKTQENKEDKLEAQRIERQNNLRNNLLKDMEDRGGVYDDLFIMFEAKKYNIAPKFVEYVYRGLINPETIKDKNFMDGYMVHNPNLDKEPHKWAKYYGKSSN